MPQVHSLNALTLSAEALLLQSLLAFTNKTDAKALPATHP